MKRVILKVSREKWLYERLIIIIKRVNGLVMKKYVGFCVYWLDIREYIFGGKYGKRLEVCMSVMIIVLLMLY